MVGRDAIQVGHATNIRVQNNSGGDLGFPAEYVDVESHGVAVALDTAGNVDQSVYANNHFTDVNGQCIDLDGFHEGRVIGNSCTNKKPLDEYPALHYGIVFGNNDPGADSSGIVVTNNIVRGFAYGAIFLVGSRNRIENNVFFDINLAHCGTTPVSARCNYALDQPDLLRSGIYLSNNGGRPAVTKDNVIRNNTIQGFGMRAHCMAAAKGVALPPNTNNCSD
jgi:parallel beta-helix repeat protein